MKIELVEVSKIFNNNERNERKLFENVNIKFDEKGIVLIKGESGIGKTTLLNIISGLDKPTSGEVKYNNIIENNKLNNFGFFFQSNNLIERLTVRENILLDANIRNSSFNYKKASNLINRLNIVEIIDKKITEISGGEKQRVALAKILLSNNEVLIVDEPTEQLDDENARIILNELLEASKDKLVIIVSHNILLIEEYANKIIEVKDNKVFLYDNVNPKQIKKKENSYNKTEITKKKNDKRRIIYSPPKYILKTILSSVLFFAIAMLLLFREKPNDKLKYRFLMDNDYKLSGLINIEHSDLSELENFVEGVPTFNLVPYKSRTISAFNISINDYYVNKEINYSSDSVRYIEITDKLIKKYNYIGNLPSTDDEILITIKDYLYFKRYGFLTKDGNELEIEKIEDMIGLELYNVINKKFIYKIVGVIDTSLDQEFMEELFFNNTDSTNLRRDQEYIIYLNNSIHSAIFLNEGSSTRNEYYEDNDYFILPNEDIDEQQLIDFLNKLDKNMIMWSNQFTNLSRYFSSDYKTYNEFFVVFLIIVLVMLVIIELLFVNIQYKKEYINIGIFMSMGYRKKSIIKDIALTKLFEYLLIASSTFTLSLLFNGYYNNKMTKYLKAKIVYLEIDLIRIIYLFIISVGITLVVIIYYLIRLSKQTILKSLRYSW